MLDGNAIKQIDQNSVHRITSGQVVIDLQTAVKELVENSLDAGASNIEVRFKHYGLRSIEVIDNGCGIAEDYHESIALKHYTSKLSSFADLSTIRTFGFRGEALSSLCALSESVTVTTATVPPMGVSLEMDVTGKVQKKHKVARQRGTTVTVSNLFLPLPVRRKELERNAKREFGKALALLNAYALGPCCNTGAAVRLTVTNHVDKGQKTIQLQTTGASSSRASVSALWGPKALENLVDLNLSFEVERDHTALKRLSGLSQLNMPPTDDGAILIVVKGLISKFSVGGGRTGTDRQFFYVNGRPCNLSKIQKSFNEVYRTFNANQAPFISADFIIPTNTCDINISPDKRTIFLHNEGALIAKLKTALEEAFAPSRSTYDVGGTQSQTQSQSQSQRKTHTQSMLSFKGVPSVAESEKRKRRGKEREREQEKKQEHGAVATGDDDVCVRATTPQRHPSVELEDGPPCRRSDYSKPPLDVPQPNPSPRSSSPSIEESQPRSPTVTQMAFHPRLRTVPLIQCQQLEAGDGMDIDTGFGVDAGRSSSPVPGVSSSSVTASHEHQAVNVTNSHARASKDRGRDDGLVIDTSTAVWNRIPPTDGAAAEVQAGENEHTERDDGPVRKKRKSDIGPTARGAEADGLTRKPGCFVIGSLKPKSGLKIVVDADVPKAKVPAAKDTRDRLRDRLAGFARDGSQVLPPIQHLGRDDGEDADSGVGVKGVEDEDEGSAEEVDQLDASDDIVQGAALVTATTPSEARALFGKSRSSSPEAKLTAGRSTTTASDDEVFDDSLLDAPIFDPAHHTPSSALCQETIVTRPEVIRTADSHTGDVALRFDLTRISAAWCHLHERLTAASLAVSCRTADNAAASLLRVPSDAGVSNTENDDRAVDALARVIEKQDFAAMEVVGQFNLGFIVARRRKALATTDGRIGPADTAMDDLFIVDQHAADEKYNFETLQQTTIIKSQKLFRPQTMELTASDELLAMENIAVLRQNGFEVEVDGEGECEQGCRLKLIAQPISKSTVFDVKDLEELIHLMRDRPAGQMVRCSKARTMFAMRACRKSVMIGMPLNQKQMSLVVQHMGTMDQPWNCPHGRPTMRHLIDIATVIPKRHVRKVDWSSAFHGI